MKTAKQSFSKELYICQKPWSEDTFCQCGSRGIVFTDKNDLEKTLTDPKEQQEAIKAVVGLPTPKKHYKTAFFEAFPRNPDCFIRGEGSTIEEAEAKAWDKFQRILNCGTHDFDRRDRTDGYVFCKKCPLSGTFLEPLTKCEVCFIPTSRYTNKDNKHFCMHHYYQLEVGEVIDDKESFLGFPKEEQEFHFKEDSLLFNDLISIIPNLSEKQWQKVWDVFIQIRARIEADHNPFFGPPTKTKAEIHELLIQGMPLIVMDIIKILKLK